MVSSRLYRDESITELSLSELLAFDQSTLGESDMVWVDVFAPSPEEESAVFQTWFPMHELVIADIRRAQHTETKSRLHHPKVEEFDTYLFLIVHALIIERADGTEAEAAEPIRRYALEQLSVVISEKVLITHHLVPIKALQSVEHMCDVNRKVMRRGPDYLSHIILDEVVDQYLPMTTKVEDRLAQIEHTVFRSPTTLTLQRILEIKRIVQEVRRSVVYQREMVNRLARGEFDLISDEEGMYYRNVYDHLVRVADQLESNRDSVMAIMDVYFSISNTRLNQVMKILTVFSSIFLPLTFVSSVYGMNFRFMPELEWQYGYAFVWGILLVIAIVMWMFIRRKGWLE
ncbi:magnesium/cobalt transporter CorA [soil metagenome]